MGKFDVEILATGSSGNCVIVDNRIMFDCGVKWRDIEDRVTKDIDRIFISHGHCDHASPPTFNAIAKVRPTLLKYGTHMNADTRDRLMAKCGETAAQLIMGMDAENIMVNEGQGAYRPIAFMTRDDMYICQPFALFHDVENCGFSLTRLSDDAKLVYIVDTMSVTSVCEGEKFDAILCEGNFDEGNLEAALSSEDMNERFRAELNLRHLSIQQFKAFCELHSKEDADTYMLHESATFGLSQPEGA